MTQNSMTVLRWIALASVWFWLIVYWQGGKKVVRDIQEAVHSRNSRLDAILLIIMTFCSLVIIGIASLASLRVLQIVFLGDLMITFTGILFVGVGVAGMFYCRHCLGRFWTAETNIAQDHQVIDTGPYRIVRHPIYSFAILMYIGFGLAFLSLWNALFVILMIAAYIFKTSDEDIVLGNKLPGYREYKLHVRHRLVPGIW